MNKVNKITIKGKVKILDTMDKKIVIKSKNKDMSSLFNYLSERGLENFPLIEKEESNLINYKYYDEVSSFNTNYDEDFIKLIADTHYKTTYYKDVSRKKYKNIYNTLIGNIDYLKDYYDTLIKKIDVEEYTSPSGYLLLRNYSIINSSLFYVERELNSWYNLVKDKTKERVTIVHNNLKRNNLLKSDKLLLTGWENYMVDTPILDIYKLYKNEYKVMNFISLFKVYNDTFKLTKEEEKLFFIMISIPKVIKLNSSEIDNINEVKNVLDYMYRTNKFIKNYL